MIPPLILSGLMFASAFLVALADLLIKQNAGTHSVLETLISAPLLFAYVLYFIQILIALYIFLNKGEFAVYTNLYIVFYSVLGVLFGIFWFKENLTALQGIGILLALGGAILINTH